MDGVAVLRDVIGQLTTDRLFAAGIVGGTSMREHQINELRKAFAAWQGDQDDAVKIKEVHKALLTAHTVSVISDEELDRCLAALDQKG